MKFFVLILCSMLLVIGCKKDKPTTKSQEIPKAFQAKESNAKLSAIKKTEAPKNPKNPKTPLNQPVITPDETPSGSVVLVNGNARFAVINFSFGPVPPVGRRIFAYRDGLKVAELKVTGPQREDNTVADIVTGEVRLKDEVKNE